MAQQPNRPLCGEFRRAIGNLDSLCGAVAKLPQATRPLPLAAAVVTLSASGAPIREQVKRTPQLRGLIGFHWQPRPPPLWKAVLQTPRLDARFA